LLRPRQRSPRSPFCRNARFLPVARGQNGPRLDLAGNADCSSANHGVEIHSTATETVSGPSWFARRPRQNARAAASRGSLRCARHSCLWLHMERRTASQRVATRATAPACARSPGAASSRSRARQARSAPPRARTSHACRCVKSLGTATTGPTIVSRCQQLRRREPTVNAGDRLLIAQPLAPGRSSALPATDRTTTTSGPDSSRPMSSCSVRAASHATLRPRADLTAFVDSRARTASSSTPRAANRHGLSVNAAGTVHTTLPGRRPASWPTVYSGDAGEPRHLHQLPAGCVRRGVAPAPAVQRSDSLAVDTALYDATGGTLTSSIRQFLPTGFRVGADATLPPAEPTTTRPSRDGPPRGEDRRPPCRRRRGHRRLSSP
jgi:hypothetical protein